MKKSAIAVAVAAVLAAPVALADVQISGQLQTQVVSVSGDAAFGANEGLYVSDGGMGGNTNGGNWGALNVAATEDLGDGMKALAKYSMNVMTDAGIGTREAYVGLAGNFGAVLGGRLNHPYKTSTIGWDPFVGTFMQARNNAGMMTDLYGAEVSNALAYAGTFGTVKVVGAMVIDEGADPTDPAKTNAKHVTSFSVNAPVGPVEVALAYINANEFSNVNTLGMTTLGGMAASFDTLTATKIGAKFGSGDLTIAGQYEMISAEVGAMSADPTAMYLTGSYKMGNNTVSVGYGTIGWDDIMADDSTYLAIGLNSALSKNTSAFVGYRNTEWQDSDAESAIGAGLRVKF